MTTRQLMIVVAVVAVPLGWVPERRSRFAHLAALHESRQMDWFENYVKPRGVIGARERKPGGFALCCWHGDLKRKFRDAARYPWLPVEADPPELKLAIR
jgi:hypothetical protein